MSDLEEFMEAAGWPPGSETRAAEALAIGRGEIPGCLDVQPGPAPDDALTAAAGPDQVDSTTGEPHTGSMVALLPDEETRDRLAATDPPTSEPAEQLHLTLDYLGDAAAIPQEAREAMLAEAELIAANLAPLEVRAFGAALWNRTGQEPSLVLSVGDDRDTPGPELMLAKLASSNLRTVGQATAPGWEPAVAHSPWVAHVCLAYGDPDYGLEPLDAAVSMAGQLEGPLRFDRLRVTFGGTAHDFELTGPEPATGMGEEAAVAAPEQEPPPPSGTGEEEPGVPSTAEANAEELVALAGEHFHTVMHVEGESTGLRTFHDVTWRTPPFSFHWQKGSSAHGGMPSVVTVGQVLRVVRQGPVLHGFGRLDLSSDDGAEYGRRLVEGFETGVSIGLDEQPVETEIVMPAGSEEDPFAEPEQIVMSGGRIGELTGVSVPAQDAATIEATDELRQVLAGKVPDGEEEPVGEVTTASAGGCGCGGSCGGCGGHEAVAPERRLSAAVEAVTAAAYTITVRELPPREWYAEPANLPRAGALMLNDHGRLWGTLAPLGTGHRAYVRGGARGRLEAPVGRTDYTRFMGAWADTAAGRIPAGPLTMDCGHAPIVRANHDVAPEHYDNACSVVGAVCCGESADGTPWLAGALLPGVKPEQVARMLTCRASGDWQPHPDRPGWSELVAALLVPSPGFASEHPDGPSATYDREGVLVASAVPVRYMEGSSTDALTHRRPGDLAPVVERIAASVGRGRRAKVAAAAARARGRG